MNINQTKQFINEDKVRNLFEKLYGKDEVSNQIKRYEATLDGYAKTFGDSEVKLFSSPGRTEISGNHTDHNHGKVIGGSINLDCVGVAGKTNGNVVRVISETFNQDITINLDNLSHGNRNTGTEELLKGILQGFVEKGFNVGGFNAYITSNVIASAGVSSSAAFETLICQIVNTLFNDNKIDIVTYAHISKFAENVYWEKSSGLLDQMCCAAGGLISIDFKNPLTPEVKKLDFDFASTGYKLIIVQTGRGHADLSEDYSSIPNEMKKVAKFFDKEVLADITLKDVLDNFMKLREYAGDRAVIRAIHFFEENDRVDAEVLALEKGDFKTFLENVNESGNSSWKYLQNCFTNAAPQEQGITNVLALTELFLKKKCCGACRVHGGGFAGVIMTLLPNDIAEEYIEYIESHTQRKSAFNMIIRPLGSICINDVV
jgi:hypothetical protein